MRKILFYSIQYPISLSALLAIIQGLQCGSSCIIKLNNLKKQPLSKIIPVILSDGSGARLWPLSRKERPKQYLPLASNPISSK